MTKDSCRWLTPELVAQALGIADDATIAQVESHITACPDCELRRQEAALAIAGAALPEADPPADGWSRLAARIEAEPASKIKITSPKRVLRISLTCTYCHDALAQSIAHYCGSCLAPHHEDCFRKHGECSAPGCTGKATVSPQDVASSPSRRPRQRWTWPRRIAAAAVFTAVAAIGYTGVNSFVDNDQGYGGFAGERMDVFVAARDIPAGRVFTEDDLEVAHYPRAVLEQSLRHTWITDKQVVIGARTQTPLKAGQILLDAHFRSGGAGSPGAAQVLVERVMLRYYRARRVAPETRDAYEQALKDLDRVIADVPKSPLPWYVRADLILQTGDSTAIRKSAELNLRKAIELQRGSATATVAEGRLAELLGQTDAAAKHYDQAIEDDPYLPWARLARANLRLKTADHDGALRDVETLRDPYGLLLARALTVRAWARFKANRDRDGALADLNHALRVDPGLARARAFRAYVALEFDARPSLISQPEVIQRARADATDALRANDALAVAHRALALVYEQHDLKKALEHADRGIELEPIADAYLLRARLRVRNKEPDRAFLDLDTVLKLRKDDARALTILAGILILRRDFDAARSHLERALELDRNLPMAFFNRGYLMLMARPRNYRKAVEDFSEAVGLDPTYGDAYFYRAVAYHDQGRYEDALQDLAQAEALHDHFTAFPLSDLHLIRGHCHYRREAWLPALGAYRAYLRLAPSGQNANRGKVEQRVRECAQRSGTSKQPPPIQQLTDVQVVLANRAGKNPAAVFEVSGDVPYYPNGTLLVAELNTADGWNCKRVQLRVGGDRFAFKMSWPKRELAPMDYEVVVTLEVGQQAKPISRKLISQFGFTRDQRVVVGKKRISLGDSDDARAEFLRRTHAEAMGVLTRLHSLVQDASQRLDRSTARSFKEQVAELLTKSEDITRPYVTVGFAQDILLSAHDSLGKLRQAILDMERGRGATAQVTLSKLRRSLPKEIERHKQRRHF